MSVKNMNKTELLNVITSLKMDKKKYGRLLAKNKKLFDKISYNTFNEKDYEESKSYELELLTEKDNFKIQYNTAQKSLNDIGTELFVKYFNLLKKNYSFLPSSKTILFDDFKLYESFNVIDVKINTKNMAVILKIKFNKKFEKKKHIRFVAIPFDLQDDETVFISRLLHNFYHNKFIVHSSKYYDELTNDEMFVAIENLYDERIENKCKKILNGYFEDTANLITPIIDLDEPNMFKDDYRENYISMFEAILKANEKLSNLSSWTEGNTGSVINFTKRLFMSTYKIKEIEIVLEKLKNRHNEISNLITKIKKFEETNRGNIFYKDPISRYFNSNMEISDESLKKLYLEQMKVLIDDTTLFINVNKQLKAFYKPNPTADKFLIIPNAEWNIREEYETILQNAVNKLTVIYNERLKSFMYLNGFTGQPIA